MLFSSDLANVYQKIKFYLTTTQSRCRQSRYDAGINGQQMTEIVNFTRGWLAKLLQKTNDRFINCY